MFALFYLHFGLMHFSRHHTFRSCLADCGFWSGDILQKHTHVALCRKTRPMLINHHLGQVLYDGRPFAVVTFPDCERLKLILCPSCPVAGGCSSRNWEVESAFFLEAGCWSCGLLTDHRVSGVATVTYAWSATNYTLMCLVHILIPVGWWKTVKRTESDMNC
jgi:hypothetical protein